MSMDSLVAVAVFLANYDEVACLWCFWNCAFTRLKQVLPLVQKHPLVKLQLRLSSVQEHSLGRMFYRTASTASISEIFLTKIVILTISSITWSILSTIALMFLKHCIACSFTPPATSLPDVDREVIELQDYCNEKKLQFVNMDLHLLEHFPYSLLIPRYSRS